MWSLALKSVEGVLGQFSKMMKMMLKNMMMMMMMMMMIIVNEG